MRFIRCEHGVMRCVGLMGNWHTVLQVGQRENRGPDEIWLYADQLDRLSCGREVVDLIRTYRKKETDCCRKKIINFALER